MQTKQNNGESLIKFLQSTKYCDFHHPSIQALANDITYGCSSDREKASRIYYWVRDVIQYRLGFWNRKASETLYELEGTCTNKANLFVALCRANNIPAGYGQMKVCGQLYFGPALIPIFKWFVSRESVHIYAVVYINDRWLHVDPSDDRQIVNLVKDVTRKADNTKERYNSYEIISWDGMSDARLKFHKDHILSDDWPLDSIDDSIGKTMSAQNCVVFRCVNTFLRDFRRKKKPFTGVNTVSLFTARQLLRHPVLLCEFAVVMLMLAFTRMLFRLRISPAPK